MGPTAGQDTFEGENNFCAPLEIELIFHFLVLGKHFLHSYNAHNIVTRGIISVIVHSLTKCYVAFSMKIILLSKSANFDSIST